jgi:hypothetical protein
MSAKQQNEHNPVEKTANESSQRMEALFADYQKFEAQQREKASEMIDEYSKMLKTGIEYGVKVGEEWRRMALQANRQAAESFSGRWF